MSELPNSWATVELGDIASFVMGQAPKAQDCNKDGIGTVFVKAGEFGKARPLIREWTTKPLKFAQAGDVLICVVGATAGKLNLAIDCAIGRSVAAIRPEFEIPQRYIYYFLVSQIQKLRQGSTGSAQGVISKPDLAGITIPLAPSAEQSRIARKVDVLLAEIDTLKSRIDTIPALLKRFRQSVLAAAVSGRLTEEWRASAITLGSAHQLHRQLKESHEADGGHARGNASNPTEEAHDLSPSDLPECWDIAEMRDICAPGRPITYGILKPGPELEEGVPYIRVADFPGNKLNLANIKKTSPEIDLQFKRARLITGDLLLSIRGSVGRLVKIPEALDGANITQDTARLSISPLVSTTFIYWVLLADSTQRRMKNATRGVAVRGINIGDVRAIQIPLPTLEEQTEVVRRVEQLFAFADQVEAKVASAKTCIGHLTQSILAKAFRGELVPQDPNDEPASMLLERIKTECAAAPKANRGRKVSA
ncbi:restriction endonuclease subunit S [Pseudomonas tolaasii]